MTLSKPWEILTTASSPPSRPAYLASTVGAPPLPRSSCQRPDPQALLRHQHAVARPQPAPPAIRPSGSPSSGQALGGHVLAGEKSTPIAF